MNGQTQREIWKCKIPEGEIGSAKIKKIEVSKDASIMESIRGNWVPEGHYTQLLINGRLVMSDTPSEYRDHYELFQHARGAILVHGLGLGCALNVLQSLPEVTSITVVEINKDVIDLVGPHFPEVEIIHADAMFWTSPKGKRYGAVWHDIWPSKCADYLPQMHKLHRRYGRKCDWQGSWSRGEVEVDVRRERRDRAERQLFRKALQNLR